MTETASGERGVTVVVARSIGIRRRARELPSRLGAAALVAIAAALCVATAAPAIAARDDVLVAAVEGVAITVSDAERSAAFFTKVLGFHETGDAEVAGAAYEHLEGVFGLRVRVVHLALGDERLDLYEYLAPRGRPVPVDSRSNDHWFQHVAIVTSDLDAAYEHLRSHRVEHASSGPQTLPEWNPQAGGIRAFYFKDRDAHVLEVIEFPPGKGDPRWQATDAGLFLGIDHTAIVVADTERSLAFYRDGLGMVVAGESENWGTEQEHLNNVFGARLRITGLRAAGGYGIELLEYLAPRDGRPIPSDLRANDLAYWRTFLRVPDLAHAENVSRELRHGWVSPGVVELSRSDLGFAAGLSLRDPDGHPVTLVHGD